VHQLVLNYVYITDGYEVLLVILKLLRWNRHWDVLWKTTVRLNSLKVDSEMCQS